ncbi:hypothetical protein VTL71DRAFT_4318 [Oculimacula yallundae]|uniref:Uncharacterized protein n=1 Tax=Oculimacula yallundae TaxID=86028 RepID=A0ABR4C6P1_9HELO
MKSIFYIEIEHSSNLTRSLRHLPNVSMRPLPRSQLPAISSPKQCQIRTLATCWELLFAIFSSSLCTSYAIHHEATYLANNGSSMIPGVSESLYSAFNLDPSPTVMLLACLVLGFSISSFAYRRQRDDRYQSLIFVLAITSSTIFGFALDINANLVMLGLIPWTLCFAMMFSVALHWSLRRCSRGTYTRIQCCEIGEKEPVPLSEKR